MNFYYVIRMAPELPPGQATIVEFVMRFLGQHWQRSVIFKNIKSWAWVINCLQSKCCKINFFVMISSRAEMRVY